jgi:hypothetical protein
MTQSIIDLTRSDALRQIMENSPSIDLTGSDALRQIIEHSPSIDLMGHDLRWIVKLDRV